jgi:hypothetical protein
MFSIRFGGSPCLFCKYAGLLYETQTLPLASSRTRIFRGRSIALLGVASINGVPPFGLAKISSFVGGNCQSTNSASLLWSIKANNFTPLDCRILFSRSTVCSVDKTGSAETRIKDYRLCNPVGEGHREYCLPKERHPSRVPF